MADDTVVVGADLQTYLRVVSRRRLVIAFTALIIVALTVAYCVVKSPRYTASAQVLIPQQAATSALNPSTDQQLPSTVNLQRNLSDDQTFAEGAAVKQAARRALGFKPTVTVTASSTADVLTFGASAGSPAQAAHIANVYARLYIDQQRTNQASQYTSQVNSLERSIAQLRAKASAESGTQQAATLSTISSLTQSVQDLQAASNLAGTATGTVVQAATAPTSPSSPRPVRDVILALLIGLILGIGLAFLVDRLDDTIKSFDDIEEFSGRRPVLGTIPLVERWRKQEEPHLAMSEDGASSASESYRTLRTAVQFLSLDEPRRVLGITSAVPGDGKTTTVANLALSFARAGQHVIVVSLDFRKPHLHRFFGLENDKGVTSVLLGQDNLRSAIQPVPGEPNLRVLPSGPVPPNPAEILALDHIVELVSALSKSAQLVLIDCPPVLPVTDTLLVSRLVDGLLVLTRAGRTRKQDLRRTVELLEQVQAPILGTIVNSVPHRGTYTYDYGYGYGYGYGQPSKRRDNALALSSLVGPIRNLVGTASGNGSESSADPRPTPSQNGSHVEGTAAASEPIQGSDLRDLPTEAHHPSGTSDTTEGEDAELFSD